MPEIHIDGWKGKDKVVIEADKTDYVIFEHRKSKGTDEIKTLKHAIPKANVDKLKQLILENCEEGQEYGYKYLVRLVLDHYKFHDIERVPLDFFMEAFNGGRNRALYYFPYLYWPLKVLEKQDLIIYKGRGGIVLKHKPLNFF